jgi:hypothetical protein
MMKSMNSASWSLHQRMISLMNRVSAPTLSMVSGRLATITINGEFRRFMVARMGSTGSTWLAKLLNSHPDACCSHEGVITQVYPATQYGISEVLRFIEYFGWHTKHGAYRVVGDVGSLAPAQLAWLPSSFTGAILLRHPARILNTRLAVYPQDQSFTVIPPETRTGVREIWGIELDHYQPIDQIFLHDAFIFVSQVTVVDKASQVLRIEDMQNPEYCQQALKTLTGLDYSNQLVEDAIRSRLNRRTKGRMPISEIVAGFTARQRDWYQGMLADILPYFGYDLLDEPGN